MRWRRQRRLLVGREPERISKCGLHSQDRSVTAAAVRTDRTRLWANAMRENAASRDFTVNALFYDPFSRLLLDYVGGMRDCKQRRLRTVVDPRESFKKDPCRLLRAIRHAARGGVPRIGSRLSCASWLRCTPSASTLCGRKGMI